MESAQSSKAPIGVLSSTDTEPIIDQFAARLIRRKANQLIGRPGFNRSDKEDIEQELRLKLIKHSSSYCPQKGHRHAFVTAIVERRAANLLRDRYAKKRAPHRIRSLNIVIAEEAGDVIELEDTITQCELDACRGWSARDAHELAELVQDMSDTIARLPKHLKELAEGLKTQSIAELARNTGVRRTTLNESVRRLRRRFEKAGLGKHL